MAKTGRKFGKIPKTQQRAAAARMQWNGDLWKKGKFAKKRVKGMGIEKAQPYDTQLSAFIKKKYKKSAGKAKRMTKKQLLRKKALSRGRGRFAD